MSIGDKKQCQTLVCAAGKVAFVLEQCADALEQLRSLYQTSNPDTTGTVLDGSLQAASTWIDNVRAVADSPVAGMLRADQTEHRTHRMNALGDWDMRDCLERMYRAAGGE